jgi:adenylate cyclase
MAPTVEVVLVTAAALGLLAFLLTRTRREGARLRRRLEEASMELQRLQQSFARFAPEDVVEGIIARGIETSGERKEVTALFADLVGFTALSESVEPAVLVRILNGYFERVSRAVTEQRGHVSTFVGDGVLALFGAFEPNPWQSNDAVHTALAIREELEDYNRELDAEGLPSLAIGVGLHRGVGVAGLVGSRDLMQYAFVGRTVNVAARVHLRPLPPATLRGVADSVAIFAVEDFAE